MLKQLNHRTNSLVVMCILVVLLVQIPAAEQGRRTNKLMADDVAQKSGQAKAAPKQLSERINLKNADGQRTLEIKPESNGAKLAGTDDKEIARYSVSEHTLKIKDAADKVLGHIVRHDDAYKIEDADRKNVLFKIAGKSNGDWSVEDGQQERLYRIKKRDYGFEIESESGASLAKVKLKDGKTSLRNAKDETLLSTKDHVSQLGLACVALDKIASEPLRLGLLVQLTIDARP